ncbi:aspartate-semialdehyde dehydrogenase [Candidatus Woesearchaeota archaeon]|nr:aspartate-semialdehyde dehydrogenase [Candidatus Woesearchaeota archaeon]
MKKLRVGILGATGMVGQRYIDLLRDHPWFAVSVVFASERSAGKSYKDAVRGRWYTGSDIPEKASDLIVKKVDEIDYAKENCDFVFSALGSSVAKQVEEKYAKDLPVVSNASSNRWTKDVPMLIPEINPEHINIISKQQNNHGFRKGFIVVKPNCSLQSYLTPLYALHKNFRIKKVIITTMQAVSGAGHPGVSCFDILDNIVPYISGEEEKTEEEPKKILGKIKGKEIVKDDSFEISAHCNRVPVIDGHMACISVKFEKKPEKEKILEIWRNFRSIPQELSLPFAPKNPIIYRKEHDRPQTRLDRNKDKGMAVVVGRLRDCKVFDYRFTALSHNTIRGAAGGGILNAELLYKRGYLK